MQHAVDGAFVVELTGPHGARLRRPRLVAPATRPRLLHDLQDRAQLDETTEDRPDLFGLPLIHHKPAIHDVVPQRADAVHPQALLLAGGELVADALGGQLALELREREEDVQHHPSHRVRGIDLLCDGHEGRAVFLEDLDQLSEVEQRSRQAINLVDHDDVDLACADIVHEALQGGTQQRAAGEAAVVVVACNRDPAFHPPAGDERRSGIALGVDRGVFRIESLVRGLAGVDRAAQAFRQNGAHRPPALRNPKKAGPLQRVPVIARAIIDRLGYRLPAYSNSSSGRTRTRCSTPA